MGILLISKKNQKILLSLARTSIRYGLEFSKPVSVQLSQFPKELQENRASFVTLHLQDKLRGCVGVIEAIRPLAEDVACNAFASAFHDDRFPPLAQKEFSDLKIHISILSTPEILKPFSEEALLQTLRMGVDGLILKEGHRKATFLPSVWDQIGSKEEFLTHLKLKAGFPPDYWSKDLEVFRYTTQGFGE